MPIIASSGEHRSRAVARDFQQQHPSPSTGRTTGPCPGYREGSYRAARLRRTRLGLQPAMADRCRCEGERSLGAEGLRSL